MESMTNRGVANLTSAVVEHGAGREGGVARSARIGGCQLDTAAAEVRKLLQLFDGIRSLFGPAAALILERHMENLSESLSEGRYNLTEAIEDAKALHDLDRRQWQVDRSELRVQIAAMGIALSKAADAELARMKRLPKANRTPPEWIVSAKAQGWLQAQDEPF